MTGCHETGCTAFNSAQAPLRCPAALFRVERLVGPVLRAGDIGLERLPLTSDPYPSSRAAVCGISGAQYTCENCKTHFPDVRHLPNA